MPPRADDPEPSSPSTLALLDLLGRRWALRILWALRQEPLSFKPLQERCDGMSTSVLSQRLGELREARLVDKDERGRYRLTEPGSMLLDRMSWVEDWTRQWSGVLGDALQPPDRSSR